MNGLLNCPNCGAPIQNDICPYCGSVFLDWAAFDISRPTFVKVRDSQGRFLLMKVKTPHVRIDINQDVEEFYADNRKYFQVTASPNITLNADFVAEPFTYQGTMISYAIIDPSKVQDNQFVADFYKEIKND